MSRTTLHDYLAENPRMVGALFALTALLAQTGTTMAANNSGTIGP